MSKVRRVMLLGMLVTLIVLTVGTMVWVNAADKTIQLKVVIGPDTPDNKAQNQATLERIKRFEKANPGVKCIPVPFTYTSRQEFFIKQAAHAAPDVLDVWATECELLVSKKWIVPLDSYLKKWDKYDWHLPNSFDPFRLKGKIYGVPFSGYVKHVIYNKQMFKDKGVPEPSINWTWDDFINAAVKTTDKEKGIAGFAAMTKGSEGGWALTDLIYQAGGEIETYKNGKYSAAFASPEAISALQFLKDMKWKYDVLPANWSNGWVDVYNVFGSGKAAIVFDADWGRNVAINGQGMDPKNVGVALMPKGNGPKGRQMGVQGGRFYVINAFCPAKSRDAAWKWLTFELWDQGNITGLLNEAEEARKNKQYRAQFEYFPLKPSSPFYKEWANAFAKNSDVLLSWGSEEFLSLLPKTAHTEPPIEAQYVYGQVLSPIVQEVLSNKNADPAKLLKDAAAKFQKDYLDKVKE